MSSFAFNYGLKYRKYPTLRSRMADIHLEKGVPVFPMFNYSFFEHCRLTQSYATIFQEFLMIVFLRDIHYSYGKEQYISEQYVKKSFTIPSLPFFCTWISRDPL